VADLVALPQRSAPAGAEIELSLAAVRSRIAVVNDRARKAHDSDDTGYALHNYRLALDHAAVVLHTLLERVEQLEHAGHAEIRKAA
jgi:hypothetical protein